MTNAHPNPEIDLHQISTRNAHAQNIIAGFASVLPTLGGLVAGADRRTRRHNRARRAGHAAFGRA